jgi:DNA-binding CsgD family transcriptional regulator
MASEAELMHLLSGIYDAALEPERWPDVLNHIADAMGSCASILGVHRLPDGAATGFVAGSCQIDLHYLSVYNANHACPENNPTLSRVLSHPIGEPIIDRKLSDRQKFLRSDLYNDVLRPQRLQDGSLTLLLHEPGEFVTWGIMQRDGAESFNDDDERLLRFLAPHLQRSVQLFLRLGALDARAQAVEEVLDRIPLGVALVSAKGQVLRLNRAAEAIVATGDGLWLGRNGLSAARSDENRSLQRLIAEAAATAVSDGVGAGGAISLSRPSGAQPLPVLVAPFSGKRLADGPCWPGAIVFIGDPEQEARSPAALLRRLYGLTRAEASLAAILLQGKDLTEAAAELGVTMNTVRTQLRGVFDKTGARRQAELIRILLRGPAGLLI